MAGLVNHSKALLFISVSILFAICLPHPSLEANKTVNWSPIINRLIEDGENKTKIIQLFARPEVRFDPRVMPRKLTHNELKLDYGKFLMPDRIERADRFLEENKQLLNQIEREYGVPKEIYVAILLIETDLGRNTGGALAFNVLASMALASNIKEIDQWLPYGLGSDEMEEMAARMKKKSEWAYQELHSLLDYAQQNGMDPLNIRGSIFGAIGICQFMPSNAIFFGVDQDGDGRVDLFSRPDAIASMANYLRSYGWAPGIDRETEEQVILKYNYSRPYADTVLSVAEKLGWNGASVVATNKNTGIRNF
ncbi:MAG: lytic murein transglycosylase [Desulfobacteraceae bacterium]|nr:lytic murein transglycosylase [Desulfobacteraceae bacterium]